MAGFVGCDVMGYVTITCNAKALGCSLNVAGFVGCHVMGYVTIT